MKNYSSQGSVKKNSTEKVQESEEFVFIPLRCDFPLSVTLSDLESW